MNLDIDKFGYKKLDNNFFNISNDIVEEFNVIYNSKDFNDNGHKNTAIVNKIENLKNFTQTESLFISVKKLLKDNKIDNLVFDDIWFVKSIEEIYEPKKLPYVPHIDKVRKLKVMVYLNDVSINDGPLFISKINPNNYEKFRKNLKPNYKIRQENEIKDLKIENYLPLKGNFGTTIVFDTNAPHFAGKIQNKNSLRKIIRFNFRLKSENSIKSFVKNLF